MARERYVVLGLARPRSEWFRAVARWATSAAIPAEFLKCVSAAELLARLGSGRPHSAVLVDGALPVLDRDLVDAVRATGAAVFVVGDARADWVAIGATAVLPTDLSPEALLDALATHASMVGGGDLPAGGPAAMVSDLDERALVAAVCGPGGTGASVVAAALAQGLVSRRPGPVVLADLALRADQAMVHDVRDVAPGIQELVEAHRAATPDGDAVRGSTFAIVDRGYDLLLGLRRARHWAALRPRAFEAAFGSLCATYDAVVCDIDADVEGDEVGAPDVADRNLMARTATAAADIVLVVGRSGTKGTHSMVRTLGDLAESGLQSSRLLPVVVDAPRSPRARAEVASTVADLVGPAVGGATAPVLFLPGRRVDDAVRDGLPMPAPLPTLLADAVLATVAVAGQVAMPGRGPVLVQPGSLGL